MTLAEAQALIRQGVAAGGTWADLGAGTGTFTVALAQLLGPEGAVWAVDRSVEAVRALRRLEPEGAATMRAVHADFTGPLRLPPLDGILMANSLHYVPRHEPFLRGIVEALRPNGRLLLVEYDRRDPNPWVPHPVPVERFHDLARAVGFAEAREIGRRRSAFGREMYAAVAVRAAENEA